MKLRMPAVLLFAAAGIATSVAFTTRLSACSRVLWNTSGRGVLVGRNMDWFDAMPIDLYVLPRGLKHEGMTGANTLVWTSKYGSLAAASPVAGVADGVNEKRLAGHMLWLSASEYGSLDAARPSLAVGYWLQYYLDNFATVRDLVAFTRAHPFQIATGTYDGLKVGVHLAFEDASGDSAVIEYRDGAAVIHHGRAFTVMTNDPPYDEQLRGLKPYKGFGGDKPLPGTTQAADRFVRAAFYLNGLPAPHSDREAVAEIMSVMRAVAQPYADTDLKAVAAGRPHNSTTRWRTVADLTRGTYFYESSTSPNIIWVRLEDLKFDAGLPIRKLALDGDLDLAGDCSRRFANAPSFEVLKPDAP